MSVKRHNLTRSPTYSSWQGLRRRCKFRESYIQRGITYCERWELFDNFLEDMGLRPEGKTIDRINNALGYSKGNCRWATPKEQARNRRNNVIITANGKSLHSLDWARIAGVSHRAIADRLKRGLPPEEIVRPVTKKDKCVRGHSLSGNNLRISNGHRICRACKRILVAEWRERRAA